MNDKNKTPDKSALGWLKSIGVPLSTALKKSPILAAVLLVLVISAGVTIIFYSDASLAYYFILALAVLAVIIIIIRQGDQTKSLQKDNVHTEDQVKKRTEPFSMLRDLKAEQKVKIQDVIKNAAIDVASTLNLPSDHVRSNVFGLDKNGKLRIVDGLTHNMSRKEELTICMPVGYGSTGRCFKICKPNIAIFQKNWGDNFIEDEELKKSHPDLRWIISIPILLEAQDQPIGVFNIDGLNTSRNENVGAEEIDYDSADDVVGVASAF